MTDKLHWMAGLTVLLPLVGSLFWFWLKPKIGEKAVGIGASLTVFCSFILCAICFLSVEAAVTLSYFDWIAWEGYSLVEFSFLLDPLSLTLGLIVTGVGSLIHLYATGYMHGDQSFGRFFTYLNLFIFSMMMLIWSENLVGVFLGWEGVGLCSYLLISFWFSDTANADAGKKAFIVNRVGDFGFLMAMFCLFSAFGSLSVSEILEVIRSGALSESQLYWSNWACLGLVLGAAGKSAQIPLYVWLPDAMAGPTPVSALIHAATMVTAGIYLICRLQPMFLLHGGILEIIAYIGGLTAFLAATIAVFQDDIKKVLAYSTISQLGYMFLAVGLTAPVAAYFHLITHAFFKALLFLGAGSVIHGVGNEQNMKLMGGLRSKMPITFWTMTIGVLAISGVPPLAGFVSKDEILHVVSGSDRAPLIFLAFATAGLTAFYMGRLWVMTFFGKYRGEAKVHESPFNMTFALVVLAVLSALGGFLNWPELWGGGHMLGSYLSQVVIQTPFESGESALAHSLQLAGLSALIGLAGLGLAWFLYKDFSGKERSIKIIREKYYVDEIYDHLIVRNLKRTGQFLYQVVDQAIIDGILNGIGRGARNLSERARGLQTGLTQSYALWVWLGLIVLLFSAWTVR